MKRRVELKMRYENGTEVHIVGAQGIVEGKPAVWKVWRNKDNIATDEEEMYHLQLSDKLRRELSEYFGVKYG